MSGFAISIYLPKKLNNKLLSELQNFIEHKYKVSNEKLRFKNKKKIKEKILIRKWKIIFEPIIIFVEYKWLNKNITLEEDKEFEYLQIKEYFGNFPEGELILTSGVNIGRKYPDETYNLITKLAELTNGFVNIEGRLSYLVNREKHYEYKDVTNKIREFIKNTKGENIEIMVETYYGLQLHHLVDSNFLNDWKTKANFFYLFY